MFPRNDRIVEVSNLLRRREDVFSGGGAEADTLASLEAELAGSLEDVAELLHASPEDVGRALIEARGGEMLGVAPFGKHRYAGRRGDGKRGMPVIIRDSSHDGEP